MVIGKRKSTIIGRRRREEKGSTKREKAEEIAWLLPMKLVRGTLLPRFYRRPVFHDRIDREETTELASPSIQAIAQVRRETRDDRSYP